MSKVWETLSGIDVSEHTEKKGELVYLSWAWAWGIVKKHYPDATFKKHLYDGSNGSRPYMFDEDARSVLPFYVNHMYEKDSWKDYGKILVNYLNDLDEARKIDWRKSFSEMNLENYVE